jgi:general secretion pathway protein K
VSARSRRGGGEDGIALLIVLLTITLLTIIVVEFTQSAEVETHFALSSRNALQAFYLARSAVNVAEALLVADVNLNKTDSEDDLWARPWPPLPVGDGTAAFRIEDEGRRLNINSMVVNGDYHRQRAILTRLFRLLGIDGRVLSAIIDWIDDDSDAQTDPPGAEQSYYLGLTPPVFVRNAPMLTMRELLQVRGMTPTLLARLEEFVTVLPRDVVKVNVNTAPAEVLYALSDGLTADPGVVDRLLAARRAAAITSINELKDVTGFLESLADKSKDNKDLLDVKSAYFRIDAVGEVNDVTRGVTTIVGRDLGIVGRKHSIQRIIWAPSTANLSLTSRPPSDFLQTLPPLGGET